MTYDDLVRNDPQAPFILNIPTVRQSDGKRTVRAVDLWFVAYGDWKTATSNEFLESLWKSTAKPKDPLGGKTIALEDADLAKRTINPRKIPDGEERWVFSQVNLFDRVLVSGTQDGIVNRRPGSVLVAQRIDSRFSKDGEYPNQWRPVKLSELG